MLDELLEYQQYSFDINDTDAYVDRLKRSRLISSDMSGLSRALTIISRYFLYDVYGVETHLDEKQLKEKTKEALKSWLGLRSPDDTAAKEVQTLYRWLPNYVERVFLSDSISRIREYVRSSNLPQLDESELKLIIAQLLEANTPEEKKNAASQLLTRCEQLEFLPGNDRVDKAISNLENFIYQLSHRKSFTAGVYADSGEANDMNAITYDRILANARRAGRLRKYYLACDRSMIREVKMVTGKKQGERKLKESDYDVVLKMTACCMLELTKKGAYSVHTSKAVHINESDFINWLILKKCEKKKLLAFQYNERTIFEHPALSGFEEEVAEHKKSNTKKIKLCQKWLEDSGFEILADIPGTDVIRDFLKAHPDGSVFIDNGTGVPMTEIKNSY